jgi:outer membrane receptor for ferrienterochelin and colicins
MSKFTKLTTAAFLMGLMAAPAASAQEPGLADKSLEELLKMQIPDVEAASKRKQKTIDAPAAVTIVTAADIERHGYRSLADLLRAVRGFFVNDDRNYSYAGVRGFGRPGDYNSRVLLLVDGHRVNDALYDGALVGYDFPLDLALIERVEVVRGPGSALYGTSAFLAVINVVTRTGASIGGLAMSTTGGSLETGRGRISFGRELADGTDLLASATLYDSAGIERIVFPGLGAGNGDAVAVGADGESFGSAFLSGRRGGFRLQGAWVSRDKTVPTGSFSTVIGDPRNLTTDERLWGDLSWSGNLGGFEVAARGYFDRYAYDGTYVYDYGSGGEPEIVLNRDIAETDWWGIETKATRALGSRHLMSVGLEFRRLTDVHQANYDVTPFEQYLEDRRTGWIGAAFLQDEVTLSDRITLSAGLRYDEYSTFGGTVSPRAALILRPNSRSALKLLYGQAFRAPNAYELFFEGITWTANPDLDPERIRTAELVGEIYFGDHVRASASVFRSSIDDLISQTTLADETIQFQNLDRASATGFEAEVALLLESGAEGRLSYAFTNAVDGASDERLSNSPRHIAQADALLPLLDRKATLGVQLLALSSRLTLRGENVPGRVVANVTLRGPRLWRALDLSASVYNVLGRRYEDPGAEEHAQARIPQERRTARVEARWTF